MATTNPALPPGEPVDPSQAQGAQIPLQNFSLPVFPPQATGLKALTLTSDIKMDEYQDLLNQDYSIPPSLPYTIESLTLELFSLGYPANWLTQLAARLPNIKSLVVYSQLLGGLTTASAFDAMAFFRHLSGLRALHLLDVFARQGFFESIAPFVTYNPGHGDDAEGARRGLMFLEINYTVQHSDVEFLGKVQATELPLLIGPGLISVAFNVSEAEETEDPEDPSNVLAAGLSEKERKAQDGVVCFNKTLAGPLVEALLKEESRPVNLRVLNLTLFTLTLEQAGQVLDVHRGLMVLILSLEVDVAEGTREKVIGLLEKCDKVEQVEIVVNPSLQFFMAVSL